MLAATLAWIFLAPFTLHVLAIISARAQPETILILLIIFTVECMCIGAVVCGNRIRKTDRVNLVTGSLYLTVLLVYLGLDLSLNGIRALSAAYHYVTKWNFWITVLTVVLFILRNIYSDSMDTTKGQSYNYLTGVMLYINLPISQTVLFLFWTGLYSEYSVPYEFSSVLNTFAFIPPVICPDDCNADGKRAVATAANIFAHLIIPMIPMCIFVSYDLEPASAGGCGCRRVIPFGVLVGMCLVYICIFVTVPKIYDGLDFTDSFGTTIIIIIFILIFMFVSLVLEMR